MNRKILATALLIGCAGWGDQHWSTAIIEREVQVHAAHTAASLS